MGNRSPRATGVLLATAVLVVGGPGAVWLASRSRPSPEAERVDAGSAIETTVAPAGPDAGGTAGTAAPSGGELKAGTAGQAPGFDLVRVEPDGQAAVAGRAAPGSTVTVLADGVAVAKATADEQGNFVAVFPVGPSDAPRALTLGAEAPGGAQVTSEDVVMLLPQAPEAAAPGEPAAEGTAGEATAAPAGSAAPVVAATAIVRDEGVEILPPAGDPRAPRRVTLGSISYAAAGDVRLAGVGTAGAAVRIYVDDRFAREVRVAGDGRWEAGLDDVAQGLYRLRIDQLDPAGRVASRVETPFQRDLPPRARPGDEAGAGLPGELTVQPGNNLWTLARTRYGSGTEFTRIYTANRDLIRDPDLIYPGQIFRVPGAAE